MMKSSKLFLLLIGITSLSFGLGSLAFAQTTNNDTTIKPNIQVPLTDQLATDGEVNQVSNQSTGTIAGIATLASGVVLNSLYSKRQKAKTNEYGKEALQAVIDDNGDSYNDFTKSLEIEEMILNEMCKPENRAKSIYDIYQTVIDNKTGETLLERKANFINAVKSWNQSYYNHPTSSISCPDPKNPMAQALTYIRKKTTES